MKIIYESINDIDCKLNIYKKELKRLQDDDSSIDRILEIQQEINKLENIKEEYIDNLSKMQGIEYRLYSYMLQGFNPTRSISKVAEENFLNGIRPATEKGIMPYYKNLKKILKLH